MSPMTRYSPRSSVTALRTFSMRTGLDASTVTPGSTAPDVSVMTPAMVAELVPCADAGTGANARPISNATASLRIILLHSITGTGPAALRTPDDCTASGPSRRRGRAFVRHERVCMVVVILLGVRRVKADGGISDERQNAVAGRSYRLDPGCWDTMRAFTRNRRGTR